jgi:hypothetical protein
MAKQRKPGKPTDSVLMRKLLIELPQDGTPRGNRDLRETLGWSVGTYLRVKDLLLGNGSIKKARGRGGAVLRDRQSQRAARPTTGHQNDLACL